MDGLLMRLGRAAQDGNPYCVEPQKSAWLSGLLSAVWGGSTGDDMPGSFNEGYHWAERWLKENRPVAIENPNLPASYRERLEQYQSSPWQTGNPPGPGKYIVTERYKTADGFEIGSDCMQWTGSDWLELEPYLAWSPTDSEILSWQPLPEPYRG